MRIPEYEQSLYFRFCIYATIPLLHSLLLPLICTSGPVLHLCLLKCFLFMSVCEIKSHFWTVFSVLRYVSFSQLFTMFFSLFCDGSCMTICLLCDLFLNCTVSPFSLLVGQPLDIYLFSNSDFPFWFPEWYQTVYVSYVGRKAGDRICLCTLFLCSAVCWAVWLSWPCSNPLWQNLCELLILSELVLTLPCSRAFIKTGSKLLYAIDLHRLFFLLQAFSD